MQAIKDKLHDISAMHHAKAEAKQQEKAEKELAKARVDVAHEVRLAREAEAEMDVHVNRAAEKAHEHETKHPELKSAAQTASAQDATTGLSYTNDDFNYAEGGPDDLSRSKR